MQPESQRIKSLPVQLVGYGGGVILKRGTVEIKIEGAGAEAAVQLVLEAAAGNGATREEICTQFASPNRPIIDNLIQQLLDRRILVPIDDSGTPGDAPEGSLDIFYWQFGKRTAEVNTLLNGRCIAILGVNFIARQLAAALTAAGVEKIQIVDYPVLRNLRLFDENDELNADQWPTSMQHLITDYETWVKTTDLEDLRCLVATSDFGSQHLLRPWNEFCLQHNLHFLPVVLRDMIGYVGPLVVPGETACLECLRARQNANLQDIEAERATEHKAFEGQMVTGFHPSMASVLGDVAAIELSKFYGGLPEWRVGMLIEVNLVATKMKARKVLRVPRCAACSNLNRRSSVTPNKAAMMPVHKYTSLHSSTTTR